MGSLLLLNTKNNFINPINETWAVFTKCKNSLVNGDRLENLAWRLWFKERSPLSTDPVNIKTAISTLFQKDIQKTENLFSYHNISSQSPTTEGENINFDHKKQLVPTAFDEKTCKNQVSTDDKPTTSDDVWTTTIYKTCADATTKQTTPAACCKIIYSSDDSENYDDEEECSEDDEEFGIDNNHEIKNASIQSSNNPGGAKYICNNSLSSKNNISPCISNNNSSTLFRKIPIQYSEQGIPIAPKVSYTPSESSNSCSLSPPRYQLQTKISALSLALKSIPNQPQHNHSNLGPCPEERKADAGLKEERTLPSHKLGVSDSIDINKRSSFDFSNSLMPDCIRSELSDSLRMNLIADHLMPFGHTRVEDESSSVGNGRNFNWMTV